jgi:hypothetical protein
MSGACASRGKASLEIDTGLANDLALQAQIMHTMADTYSGFFSKPNL